MSELINDDDDETTFDETRDESSNGPTTTLIEDKWSCSSCTYLNYAVAQRCTMCRQARVTTMDAASADIYQSQAEQAQQQIPATYIDSVEKWSCDQCTFLNYPRAIRCTQCGSYRLIGTTRLSSAQPSSDCPSPNERNSPPLSIEESRLLSQRLRKWSCGRCTTDSK